MSLLPNNSSLIDQQIAEMFAAESQESYKSLKIDPLTCHASILEHLALEYGIDISILNEALARTFLSNSIKNRPVFGTVQAVESLLELFFENGKLVEWFDDEKNLEVGEFSFSFKTKDNLTYNNQTFSKFLKLLKSHKNVRSHLKTININIPTAIASVFISTLNSPITLIPNNTLKETMKTSLNIETATLFNPSFYVDISEVFKTNSINLKGGHTCQVVV
jgi:P2-related tail formation protein